MRGDEEQERRWLASCRKGDSGACARVVRAYQDTALRTAFLMTNDRQAAEDVAQNAFLNAFRHLNRFDLERPFRPWFLTILSNEARMHLQLEEGSNQVNGDTIVVYPDESRMEVKGDNSRVKLIIFPGEGPLGSASPTPKPDGPGKTP
jgi:DNA-directed RNA polymerase specialized sigma24 family protein